MQRALAKFLHLANRLARELLSLLHNQLNGHDDATQDLLDGDGNADRVAKRKRQSRRREMRRPSGGNFPPERKTPAASTPTATIRKTSMKDTKILRNAF